MEFGETLEADSSVACGCPSYVACRSVCGARSRCWSDSVPSLSRGVPDSAVLDLRNRRFFLAGRKGLGHARRRQGPWSVRETIYYWQSAACGRFARCAGCAGRFPVVSGAVLKGMLSGVPIVR